MIILGHRGAILPNENPYQNSEGAFDLALKYADGFETDACISADGDVFLIHEAKYVSVPVEYCLNEHLDQRSQKIVVDKRLDQMSTEMIKNLCLKSGQPIPMLKQVMKQVGNCEDNNKILNIELKGNDVNEAVLREVNWALDQKVLTKNQFILSSFNHKAILNMKSKISDVPMGLMFALPNQQHTSMFPWMDNENGFYEPFSIDYLRQENAQNLNPEWIVIAEPILSQDLAISIKEILPNVKIAAWVFTELNDGGEERIKSKMESLEPQNLLHAVMIDNPTKIKR